MVLTMLVVMVVVLDDADVAEDDFQLDDDRKRCTTSMIRRNEFVPMALPVVSIG